MTSGLNFTIQYMGRDGHFRTFRSAFMMIRECDCTPEPDECLLQALESNARPSAKVILLLLDKPIGSDGISESPS